MGATRETWTGSSIASTVIGTQIPANEDRYEAIKTEVEAARDGESTLLAKQDAQDASIAGLVAASGIKITANDTTLGNWTNKVLMGYGLNSTLGNSGANETTTIDMQEGLKRSYLL